MIEKLESKRGDDRQTEEEEKRQLDFDDDPGNNRRNLKRAAKTEGLELIKVCTLSSFLSMISSCYNLQKQQQGQNVTRTTQVLPPSSA